MDLATFWELQCLFAPKKIIILPFPSKMWVNVLGSCAFFIECAISFWNALNRTVHMKSLSTIKIEIYTEMCSYLLQVFSNVFILLQTLLISQLQPYKYFVYWQTELSPSPVYGQTELSPWREPSLWINHSSIL